MRTLLHSIFFACFFLNDTATTEIYTLSLHDALPIWSTPSSSRATTASRKTKPIPAPSASSSTPATTRSEEHTSELQSLRHLVCRLLLEKKKTIKGKNTPTVI